jgi:serine/threonine protein kinase
MSDFPDDIGSDDPTRPPAGDEAPGPTQPIPPPLQSTEPESSLPSTDPATSLLRDVLPPLYPDPAVAGLSEGGTVYAPAALPPVSLVLEGFQILGELGHGGMGVVYKAWQPSLQRYVALKVIRPPYHTDSQQLARFRREARAVSGLNEPGILQVFEILETLDGPVIVLPLVDGSDLGKILGARRAALEGRTGVPAIPPWSSFGDAQYLDWALAVLDRLIDAVVALHRAEVLHRDIKPSNVLIDRSGHVFLSDFGLAGSVFHRRPPHPHRSWGRPATWLPSSGRVSPTSMRGPTSSGWEQPSIMY